MKSKNMMVLSYIMFYEFCSLTPVTIFLSQIYYLLVHFYEELKFILSSGYHSTSFSKFHYFPIAWYLHCQNLIHINLQLHVWTFSHIPLILKDISCRAMKCYFEYCVFSSKSQHVPVYWLCIFFKIVLIAHCPLQFCINFKISWFLYIKRIGNLVEFIFNVQIIWGILTLQ